MSISGWFIAPFTLDHGRLAGNHAHRFRTTDRLSGKQWTAFGVSGTRPTRAESFFAATGAGCSLVGTQDGDGLYAFLIQGRRRGFARAADPLLGRVSWQDGDGL